jgi:hypothetical protein
LYRHQRSGNQHGYPWGHAALGAVWLLASRWPLAITHPLPSKLGEVGLEEVGGALTALLRSLAQRREVHLRPVHVSQYGDRYLSKRRAFSVNDAGVRVGMMVLRGSGTKSQRPGPALTASQSLNTRSSSSPSGPAPSPPWPPSAADCGFGQIMLPRRQSPAHRPHEPATQVIECD